MSPLRVVMLSALLLASLAGGCATPSRDYTPPDVTLSDIHAEREQPSGTGEQATKGEPDDARRTDRPTTTVSLQSFDLPLEFTLEEAFAYAKPAPLPRLSLGVWQANGIRVAVLPIEDWPKFYAKLPEALEVRQTRILASDDPVAVVTSPRLVRPIRIDLTVPPMRPRETWARRGRLRLLAEVAEVAADNASPRRRVSLIPHHLLPQSVALPDRTPVDRMPGVVFDRLTLRMDLSPDTLLILALDRPWDRKAPETPDTPDTPGKPGHESEQRDGGDSSPVAGSAGGEIVSALPAESADDAGPATTRGDAGPAEEKGKDEADAADGAEARGDTPRRSDASEVPPNLGRALLAGQKWDRPLQRLVVISVRPLRTGSEQPAP
jgi:hypothetical protein